MQPTDSTLLHSLFYSLCIGERGTEVQSISAHSKSNQILWYDAWMSHQFNPSQACMETKPVVLTAKTRMALGGPFVIMWVYPHLG